MALGESARDRLNAQGHNGYAAPPGQQLRALDFRGGHAQSARAREVTGYACACPEPTAPTTPGVVLDPFGGTGTTALVADALGRHGISVDMSADYCRLAEWRTTDPKQRAKAARKPFTPPAEQVAGQISSRMYSPPAADPELRGHLLRLTAAQRQRERPDQKADA